MANIKFLNRKKEIEIINNLKKDNFFIVVKGRRRIGKTTFLKKCFHDAVYIFIWPNKSIGWINERICKDHNLPSFKNFTDIIVYLLDKKKVVIIDEFQNFLTVDKSIFGEVQLLIDERKKSKFLKIAVAGSSYSLINKVFGNVASPLYGRRTAEITLFHLPVKDIFNALKISLEEFIKLWSVFEGVPYYYEMIDTSISTEENIKKLIVLREGILQSEGEAVLSVEFGQDSKTYNTLLMAIAEGKTKLNEIANVFGNKKNEVIKYLSIVRKEFKLIKRITPINADIKKSKEGRYELVDNFMDFWFYFIDRQKDFIEQERFQELELFFKNNFNSFVGKKFERFIKNLIETKIVRLNFEPIKIGKQWGKIKGAEKGKNTYEIDICAINEKTKQILFCECKWKDKVNPEKVIKELKEKSKYVDWYNNERKEYYTIFAKSFKKKIKQKNIYLFDLKDLEKTMKT